jgi:hypothetical protein
MFVLQALTGVSQNFQSDKNLKLKIHEMKLKDNKGMKSRAH